MRLDAFYARREDAMRLSVGYVEHQLLLFGGGSVSSCFATAQSRALRCFESVSNKYYNTNEVNPLHTGQYASFLLFLARAAYENGDRELADKVYALNKMLHGFDIYYEVELPDVFFFEHPVGTVLGRARYSNRLFVGQNVTVGGNKGKYPTIGENVALHAGCMVIGDARLGDNVEVSAGAIIKEDDIPSNCLVFGASPHLIVKKRTEEEMLQRLYYFKRD